MHSCRRATLEIFVVVKCGAVAVAASVSWSHYCVVVLEGVTTGGSWGKHMGSWVKIHQIFLFLQLLKDMQLFQNKNSN